jgi:hypothetical protein
MSIATCGFFTDTRGVLNGANCRFSIIIVTDLTIRSARQSNRFGERAGIEKKGHAVLDPEFPWDRTNQPNPASRRAVSYKNEDAARYFYHKPSVLPVSDQLY